MKEKTKKTASIYFSDIQKRASREILRNNLQWLVSQLSVFRSYLSFSCWNKNIFLHFFSDLYRTCLYPIMEYISFHIFGSAENLVLDYWVRKKMNVKSTKLDFYFY